MAETLTEGSRATFSGARISGDVRASWIVVSPLYVAPAGHWLLTRLRRVAQCPGGHILRHNLWL